MEDEVEDRKKVDVEKLHEHISADRYEIDAAAVAEAIVKRLLEGKTLPTR